MEELECPEHVENPINRKITIFYIETRSQKISTPIFFRNLKFEKNLEKFKIFMILGQNQWKTKEINGFPLFFINFGSKS